MNWLGEAMRNSRTKYLVWASMLVLLVMPILLSIVTSPSKAGGLFSLTQYIPFYGELVIVCVAITAGGLMEGIEALVIRERKFDSARRGSILFTVCLLFLLSAVALIWFGTNVGQNHSRADVTADDILGLFVLIVLDVLLVAWLKKMIWSARPDEPWTLS